MNRKQKVPVVVGALVVALLALFPPWWAQKVTAPNEQEMQTVRTYDGWLTTQVDPSDGPHESVFGGFRWIASTPTRTDDNLVDAKPEYAAAISLQIAALALTVAAVLVLKERR